MDGNRTYSVAAHSSNSTSQFPCGKYYKSIAVVSLAVWTTLHCVVALLVILSNTLVIMSFVKNANLRTRTNYLIVSLALADLLVGLVSAPGWLVLLYKEDEFCLDWYTVVMEIWSVFEILGGVGSIFHLMALSWDRLCAIVWPLRHRSYHKRKYVIIISLIWSCATLVSGVSVPGNRKATHAYNVSVICLCFFLPLILIFVAQGITLFTIKQNSAKFHRSTSMKRDVRAAKTIAIMIGLFLIGWLPFFSLGLVQYTHGDFPVVLSAHAICAVKLLQYGNSLFNPILYSQKFPEFRKAYIKILCNKKSQDDILRMKAANNLRMTSKFHCTLSSSNNSTELLRSPRSVLSSVTYTDQETGQTEYTALYTVSEC